jgi:hypothetical protein
MVVSIRCIKCNKIIPKSIEYAITIFLVKGKLSDPHYEHIICPEKFSIDKRS